MTPDQHVPWCLGLHT